MFLSNNLGFKISRNIKTMRLFDEVMQNIKVYLAPSIHFLLGQVYLNLENTARRQESNEVLLLSLKALEILPESDSIDSIELNQLRDKVLEKSASNFVSCSNIKSYLKGLIFIRRLSIKKNLILREKIIKLQQDLSNTRERLKAYIALKLIRKRSL